MIIQNKKLIKYTYLDWRRIFKYYPNIILYIAYGAGGVGKTESARRFLKNLYKSQIEEIKSKIWDIDDYRQHKINIKNKFVWLNRTDTEIKEKKKELFADLGWTSSGGGNKIQIIIPLKIIDDDGEEDILNYYLDLGKYEAINNASKIRGGNSFDEYMYVFWDEFMDEHDKYLPDEIKKVKSILMTVLRSKTQTKWIFMSNAITKGNSLFKAIDFDSNILEKGQQAYIPERKTLVWYVEAPENLGKKYEKSDYVTVWGKEDDYFKYRFEADFANDDEKYIERTLDPRQPLKPKFNVIYLGTPYGVYEYKRGLYFSEKIIEETDKFYPLSRADAVKYGLQFRQPDSLNTWFYACLKGGKIYFEDEIARETILTFISKGR